MKNRFINFLRNNVIPLRLLTINLVIICLEIFAPFILENRDASGKLIDITIYHYYDISIFKQGLIYPLITLITTSLTAILLIVLIITKKLYILIINMILLLATSILIVIYLSKHNLDITCVMILFLLVFECFDYIVSYSTLRKLKNKHQQKTS